MIVRRQEPGSFRLVGTLRQGDRQILERRLDQDDETRGIGPTIDLRYLDDVQEGAGDTLRALADLTLSWPQPRSLIVLVDPESSVWSKLQDEGLMDLTRSPKVIVAPGTR